MILKLRPAIFQITRAASKLSYIHNVGTQPLLSITAGQLVEEATQKYPHRPAVISCHQKKKLTFSELLYEVDNFATGLRKLDVNYGDNVAIWSPNAIEWIVTSLACARLGATLVQLNSLYMKNELIYSVNKTKAKALVCGYNTTKQNYLDIITSIDSSILNNGTDIRCDLMPTLRSIVMMDDKIKGTHYFHALTKGHSEDELRGIREHQIDIQIDDPINIQFTSGTTGAAKAAILSHHAVINNSYYMGKLVQMDKKHHTICVQVPLFHAFGTTHALFAMLHFGATLVLPTDFYNPRQALQAILDQKCTFIYGTPTMHMDLVMQQKKHKFHIHPEFAITGGSTSSPQLIFDMYKYLGYHSIFDIYGLTETAGAYFQLFLGTDSDHVANSVGHISEYCEIKVIDEDGKIVPVGQSGELCVRGYLNMLGYLDEPTKTAEIIGPDRWLKTGDKFILYADGTGKIVGRIKDIIIRGGENIHPKEVEDYLSSHPKLIDCQVVGFPHQRLGEEVCACIRLNPAEEITLQEVIDYCRGHMAYYMIPSKIHVLEQYPKTTSGKILKFQLIELLKEHYKNAKNL